MARRYAKTSAVPLVNSKREIEKLLEEWGCKKVAMLNDLEGQRLTIQFFWTSEEPGVYAAQFSIDLKPDPKLPEKKAIDEVRGRMRTLFYWLRSAFAAIDTGVITAEEVFLPWIVGADGMTVAQALLPRLKELPGMSMRKMLGA